MRNHVRGIGLFLLCSCSKEGNDLKVTLASSDATVTDLVSKTYSDSELLTIAQFQGTMKELNVEYPMECVREMNGIYRVSYLGQSKIATIIFDEKGNILIGNVYDTVKRNSDFEDLLIGQSLDEVKKFDPNGGYLFLYTGKNNPRISTHYTLDGYLISIEYDDKNRVIDIKRELI